MQNIKSYTTGFILSIILTLAAYFFVMEKTFSPKILLWAILVLALIQLVVQLKYFLHLSGETGPRWNQIFFASTVGIILVVVIGSLWIMDNLSYHMPTSEEIIKDEGILR